MDNEAIDLARNMEAPADGAEQTTIADVTPLRITASPSHYQDPHRYIEREQSAKERRKLQNRRAQQTFRQKAKRRAEWQHQATTPDVSENGASFAYPQQQHDTQPTIAVQVPLTSRSPSPAYHHLFATQHAIRSLPSMHVLDATAVYAQQEHVHDKRPLISNSQPQRVLQRLQHQGSQHHGTRSTAQQLSGSVFTPGSSVTQEPVYDGEQQEQYQQSEIHQSHHDTNQPAVLQSEHHTLSNDTGEPLHRKQSSITSRGRTPLHQASMHGFTPVVRILLDAQADLSARDEKGRTPLHAAAIVGHADIALLLVEAGADVDAVDDAGATPLFLAASNGREDIVRVLVDNGADTDIAAP